MLLPVAAACVPANAQGPAKAVPDHAQAPARGLVTAIVNPVQPAKAHRGKVEQIYSWEYLKQKKHFCCSLIFLPDFKRNDPVCGAFCSTRFPGLSDFALRPLNSFQLVLLDIIPDDLTKDSPGSFFNSENRA